MKEQSQPDPKKKLGTPEHGYGPMVAITSGTCGFSGFEPDTTQIAISPRGSTASKVYDCGTRAKAQAVVSAVQNNAYIYDAAGISDTILLYGSGGSNISAGQLWTQLAEVPTIDAQDPSKVTFKYPNGTGGSQSIVVTVSSSPTPPANLVAFAKTLMDGGWPSSAMTLGLGYVYSASTGAVQKKSEAGWVSVGLILPTSS